MIYLKKDSILTRILPADLEVLTGGVDEILNLPELDAIQEVSSYLSYRYKTDLIFAPDQEESRKFPIIQRILIDILLYNLTNRLNPRNIPEKRIELREDALDYLKAVANPRSNVSADYLPIIEQEEERPTLTSWGSKQKRNNNY
jgi:phage gp36-like protein